MCVIGNNGGEEIAFINLSEGTVLKTIQMREQNWNMSLYHDSKGLKLITAGVNIKVFDANTYNLLSDVKCPEIISIAVHDGLGLLATGRG